MPRSALTTLAPDGEICVVLFGIGAKDARRVLRQVSGERDRIFYAWKDGSRWHAYVKHRQRGFVHGRGWVVGMARQFADDFNVSDVVDRWTENGPRAQLAIVVWIQPPASQDTEEKNEPQSNR